MIYKEPAKKESFVRETVTMERPVQPCKIALGQYFTPFSVVEFMYQMLFTMMPAKEKRNPRIIDPACGEGIFLKYALDNKITVPHQIYGLDIDPTVETRWKELNLFGKINLYFQDGLLDTEDRKISTEHAEEIVGRFDIVIGNPPYGGIGIKELEKNIPLMTKIRKYELWQKARVEKRHKNEIDFLSSTEQIDLSGNMSAWDVSLKGLPPELRLLKLDEKEKIEKTPIEIFFLERFIQLARPGKWIAIIVPDGILANTQLQYVRDWVMQKTKIKAIISLPRETFKYAKTTAKTSVMFLQKLRKDEIVDPKMEIFMAVSEYVGVKNPQENDLPIILEEFKKSLRGKKIIEGHRSPKFMIKISGTHEEFPRIDADYWDPKYAQMIKEMKKNWKVEKLRKFITHLSYGQVGKRIYHKKGEVKYFQVNNIRRTGIDYWLQPATIKSGSHNDPGRTRLQKNDILLINHGVGSIGRSITISADPDPSNISQDIDLIRVAGVNPFYVSVFLNTLYGQQQIQRFCSGVSGIIYIRFDDVREIQIPLLTESIQQKTESEYKKMSKYYDKAMEIKKELIENGLSNKEAEKNTEYQKYIRKAEEMLRELVKQTEEIIEGKRNDIS